MCTCTRTCICTYTTYYTVYTCTCVCTSAETNMDIRLLFWYSNVINNSFNVCTCAETKHKIKITIDKCLVHYQCRMICKNTNAVCKNTNAVCKNTNAVCINIYMYCSSLQQGEVIFYISTNHEANIQVPRPLL